jgi:hypothetical protein
MNSYILLLKHLRRWLIEILMDSACNTEISQILNNAPRKAYETHLWLWYWQVIFSLNTFPIIVSSVLCKHRVISLWSYVAWWKASILWICTMFTFSWTPILVLLLSSPWKPQISHPFLGLLYFVVSYSHTVCVSTLEFKNFTLQPLHPRGKSPWNLWYGDWACPTAGLDVTMKRKSLLLPVHPIVRQ